MRKREPRRESRDDFIAQLKEIVQLHLETARAYNQALANREVPEIHRQLSKFRSDHVRHAVELTHALELLGVFFKKSALDLKGFLLEKISAMRALTGTEGALKVMRKSEMTTNECYLKISISGLPPNLNDIIRRNLDDEKHHLRYLNALLNRRPWDVPHSTSKEKF